MVENVTRLAVFNNFYKDWTVKKWHRRVSSLLCYFIWFVICVVFLCNTSVDICYIIKLSGKIVSTSCWNDLYLRLIVCLSGVFLLCIHHVQWLLLLFLCSNNNYHNLFLDFGVSRDTTQQDESHFPLLNMAVHNLSTIILYSSFSR